MCTDKITVGIAITRYHGTYVSFSGIEKILKRNLSVSDDYLPRQFAAIDIDYNTHL